MKLSNNAIKFLMAQYRAIYKNAYFKGIASAVVLTAGLAAGAANAAVSSLETSADTVGSESNPINVVLGAAAKTESTGGVKVTGGDNYIAGNEGGSNAPAADFSGALLQEGGNLIIGATENAGSGGGIALTFKGNESQIASGASLTVKAATKSKSQQGVTDTSLTLKNLTVGGTIEVVATGSGTASISGDAVSLTGDGASITIKGATGPKEAKFEAASFALGSGSIITVSGDGTSTLGKDATTYDLAEGSTIVVGANGAIKGASITSNGGTISFASATEFGLSNYNEGGTAKAQKLNLTAADQDLTVKLTASGTNRGVLHFASGSEVDLGTGALKIVADSSSKGSVVKFDNGATLTAGKIAITGGSATSLSELTASASDIAAAVASGGATITSGSLYMVGNQNVELGGVTDISGETIKLKVVGTETAGALAVTGANTTINATNLTVADTLTGVTASNLAIDADNLTLGNDAYAKEVSLGAGKFTAKNLTLKSANGFKLKDEVTLSSSGSGSISGNLMLTLDGGALTVTSGKYTADSSITLGSGSLTVGSGTTATGDASLTVNGNIVLAAAGNTAGGVKISGSGSIVDLSKGSVSYDSSNSGTATKFDLSGDSVQLKIGTESLASLIRSDATTSGAQFKLGGANTVLTAVGDGEISLKKANIITDDFATSKNGISLSGDNAHFITEGKLIINGDTDGEFGLGAATKKITAGSLELQNTATSSTLKSGNYTVSNGLSTSNGLTVSGDATLNLGSFTEVEKAEGQTETFYTGSTGGQIGGDLTVSGGSVVVDAGKWTADKVTVTTGKFTVGQNDKKDSKGEVITASLTAKDLTVSAAATVEKAGTLTTNKLSTGAELTVNGALNINTEYDSTGADALGKFGLNLGNDTIVLGKGATATLEGTGVQAALGIVEGGEVTKAMIEAGMTGNSGAFNSSGAFTDNTGSVLKINIADKNTSFAADALDSLQKALFGDAGVKGTIDIGEATMAMPIDGEVLDWHDAKITQSMKNVLPNYANEQTKNTVVLAKNGDTIYGHFANIKVNSSATDNINFEKNASLNKADANGNLIYNKDGKVLGATVKTDSILSVNAAGNIGAVNAEGNSEIFVKTQNGTTNIASISGTGASLNTAGNLAVAGDVKVGKLNSTSASNVTVAKNLSVGDNYTEVAGTLKVGGNAEFKGATAVNGNVDVVGNFTAKKTLDTAKGSTLKVTSGSFTASDDVTALGAIEVTGSGSVATFTADAFLKADGNKFVDVKFGQLAEVRGDTVATGKVTAAGNVDVFEGAAFQAKELYLNNGNTLRVGTSGTPESQKPTTEPEDLESPSNAYLSVESLKLNGASLVVDPDYDMGASVAAVKGFSDAKAEAEGVRGFAGTVDGNIYALQNSIVAIGSNDIEAVKGTFAKYFDEKDGSLGANGISSIAYVAESISVKDGNKIVIDPEGTDDKVNNDYQEDFDLNISEKSALAVDYQAVKDGKTAVTFAKNDAKVYVDKTDAKVLLTGKGFSPYYDIKLFGSSAASGSVSFVDGSATELTVETVNGLFSAVITDLNKSFDLDFSEKKARVMMGHISEPVRESIITYTMGDLNYTEQDPKKLVSVLGDVTGYRVDAKNALLGEDGKAVDLTKLDPTTKKQLIADGILNSDGSALNRYLTKDTEGNLYYIPENVIFNGILDGSLDAVDAETAARLADFGGVAQAALRAGNTTSDAIAARMGVGVNGTVTFAANGQGSGMWVTPVYKTADSDSFGADGVDYGTDMNLYGVAVGADVSVMENVSAGVMFNVGSGDADGQGLGSNVKNDFDYYGFGAYMGYTMGAASVVADLSWTTVDNSVEGHTGVGTLAASIDSSALSLGVTGKYAMDFGGVNVTPHAGLRFTRIDQDDYTVGNGTDLFAQYSSNSMNVFSVPVGVTVEKEYTFDAWSVKPAFDLTLTGNFGDDETSGTVDWEGISNLSTDVKSEFVDTFTYSTAIGVAAQTGNFGMGLGVNYTGASNVKEFGVNANVRYVF